MNYRTLLKTVLALALLAITAPLWTANASTADTAASDPVIASIRDEGLNRSQVMQTLRACE